MSDMKSYHRLGEPGGPGCAVTIIKAVGKNPDGTRQPIEFWNPDANATELELLRTVAARFDVNWGHDDLGWWAAVPVSE
jgi:hypothetical protein